MTHDKSSAESAVRGFKEWLRGAGVTLNCVDVTWEELEDELTALILQREEMEREACALVCDSVFPVQGAAVCADKIQRAIRTRGNK